MGLVNISSLNEFNMETGNPTLTVVDFYADWCGPCKAIAPRYEALSKQHPTVSFLKVNTDTCSDVAQKCGIRAMPTFHFYKSGKLLKKVVGADINQVTRLVSELSSSSGGGGRVLGSGKAVGDSNADQTQVYIMYALFGAFLLYYLFGKGDKAAAGATMN